jgi:hypothetical protein
MSCIVCTMSCNFVVYATCPLTFTTHKYNELQGQLQNTIFSHSET